MFRHSRPYHPQTCGKVERFHQTLKKWLARQPWAATIGRLQAQLDTFTIYHNTVGPHRALDRSTLRHNSRLHHIGVGRRHAGTDILVLVHDLYIRVLTADGELLRELHLDLGQDYQPQPKP